jgi:hypothetical protein
MEFNYAWYFELNSGNPLSGADYLALFSVRGIILDKKNTKIQNKE